VQPIFPTAQPKPNGSADVRKSEEVEAGDARMEEEKILPQEVPEQVNDHREKSEPKSTEEQQELGFSIFDNDVSSRVSVGKKGVATAAKTNLAADSPSASMKRKVPGSFSDDDEDEDMVGVEHHHTAKAQESEDEAISGRTARSGKSLSARSTASHSNTKSKSKRNESRDSKRRRSSPHRTIPGSLMDEPEGEEEDHVAPLRSNKGSSRTKSGRASRGSTASDLADELGEGVQTRRRSSRLTTAVSTGSVDGEMSPRKSTRTKKPTAKASAVRKKRTY
jgi:hypothetical protein